MRRGRLIFTSKIGRTGLVLGVVSLLAAPMAVLAGGSNVATAEIVDGEGVAIGKATLTETPKGVLIEAGFEGLAAGLHAFHIHEVGVCDATTAFVSAGGHFNPNQAKHGLLSDSGAHLGDLPNLHAPADSSFVVEIYVPGLSLAEGPGTLFDEDGASLVVHEHRDDYVSDPSGAAGPRIACGVIRRSS